MLEEEVTNVVELRRGVATFCEHGLFDSHVPDSTKNVGPVTLEVYEEGLRREDSLARAER